MDAGDVLAVVAVAAGAFVLWLTSTALLIWAERRVVAKMQSRLGPNRLGPFGLLQVVADGAKMFFKEDVLPRTADKAVYFVAPVLSVTIAVVTFAVVPFGGTFEAGGREVSLQVWDPEFGLLWILAMSSLGVYGIMLAGWSSGTKYPLLGGVRSSAQMLSYELAMGLGLASVFVWNGTLRSSEIVEAQAGTFFGTFPAWNVFPMLPALLLFFGAAVAETQRPPFDLPEAEGELVAGFMTEYSGAKYAMFMLGEFMNVVTMSAVVVTMFLGGPTGPTFGPEWLQAVMSVVYFLLKTALVIFVFIWLRGTLPRVRYDRLMDLGWKVMLPLGLVWVMITAAVVVLQETADRETMLVAAGVGAAVLLAVAAVSLLAGRGGPADDADDGAGAAGEVGGGADEDEEVAR